jgi:AraC-like DNA-binding protein
MSAIPPVQRPAPVGRLAARRVYALPLEQVRPFIRLAHRRQEAMNIGARVIVDHEFVLIRDGTGEFSFPGGRVAFAPHDLFFIPPFVPHSIRSAPGRASSHLAVHFDFAPGVPVAGRALERRAPYEVRFPEGLTIPQRTALVASDRVEQDFATLVDAWQSGGKVGGLEATAALLRILATLLRRQQTHPGAHGKARIEKALALLQGPPVPVATLARATGLSVSHFNREFREWTGYAPVEYQRRHRIGRARALLADGTLSIKEVAARVGFDDPYHFSRVFRQVDGLSPSQYRAAMSHSSIG